MFRVNLQSFKFSNLILYVFILNTFLFFNSCEFQLSDINESYIEKPSEIVPEISFELTPDVSILKLYEPVTIKYQFDANPRKVHWVKFDLDGLELFYRDYEIDELLQFILDTRLFSEGSHILTISVFTSSNSGSIADKAELEGYIYQLQWPVIIDRTPPKILNILSIDSVLGGVKIIWEKFDHPSFDYYKLVKHSYTTNQSVDLALITSTQQNSFIDETYLEGEEANYRIWLGGLPGEYRNYLRLPVPPSVTLLDEFSVKVEWKQPVNPSLLDYYYLYTNQEDYIIHDGNKIYSIETTSKILENLSFGWEYNFAIKYVPKTISGSFNFYGIKVGETKYMIGNRMPNHRIARMVNGKNEIFLTKNDKLYRFDLTNKKVIDSLSIEFDINWSLDVSPDGKYFGYSKNGEFFLRETAGLNTIAKVGNPAYSGTSDNLFLFTISNNKFLLSVFRSGLLELVNLETGEQIDKKQLDFSLSYSKISPDGKHVLVKRYGSPFFQYFDISQGTFIEQTIVDEPTEIYYDYFVFGVKSQIYLFKPGLVQVRNPVTFNIEREITVPTGYIEGIDIINEEILIVNNGQSSLVNMQSGNIIKTFNINTSSFIAIHNGYITSGAGSFMYLKNKGYNSNNSISCNTFNLTKEQNKFLLK